MRILLILVVIVAACYASFSFSVHHHDESPFKTLYMHLIPAPLVVDNHAPHDELEPLLAVPLPAALSFFDWRAPALHVDELGHESLATAHGPELAFFNLQLFQLAAVLITLIAFAGVPNYLKRGTGDRISRLGAGFVMWIREEMVVSVMGRKLGDRYLPYFLSIFFFIFFMNLLGLVPGAATATASIYVTAALALTTLLAMIGCGMYAQGPVAFWKNLVPHVPAPLWPLMFIVEVVGLIVKPFALMIRLFANLSGGHMVVLSFMGLMFFFAQRYGAAGGWGTSPLSVGFAVFIMIIEGFVAMLQAYIFTQLSILFVHTAVHPEH
ncbi:MAG: F0F1 ATP synthase subunit A [Planctomycetota bacterium]